MHFIHTSQSRMSDFLREIFRYSTRACRVFDTTVWLAPSTGILCTKILRLSIENKAFVCFRAVLPFSSNRHVSVCELVVSSLVVRLVAVFPLFEIKLFHSPE